MITAGLVAAGVSFAIWGFGKLAGKTRNKVDDKIVEYVRTNAPAIVAAIERAVDDKGPKPKPRDRVVDHRRK